MSTQKSQMLASTSPGAAVAAARAALVEKQNNKPADPAAPDAAAPGGVAEVQANLPNPPAAGEKCQTCGQVMPDDDGEPTDPDSKAAAATAAAAAADGGYTLEMAAETMDLCTIAKAPLADAKAFIAAKTPIKTVRAQLAAKAAAATDALAVDGTAKPAGKAEAAVAASWDEVVNEINAGLPGAAKR